MLDQLPFKQPVSLPTPWEAGLRLSGFCQWLAALLLLKQCPPSKI